MKWTALLAAGLLAAASPSVAQETSMILKARQGQFNLIALNLGVLGNMARGRMDYDAATAQAAADSLAGIAMLDQTKLWVEGTDNVTLAGQTRAQPNIFEDTEGFLAIWARFQDGAMAAQAVAGDGVEALGPALGMVGGTCRDCHQTYRGPEN